MPDTITNFTAIEAQEVQLMLNDKWKEPNFSKEYSAEADTVKAILEFQTAQFKELEDPEKDREFTVNWFDFCSSTIDEDSTDDDMCEIPECQTGEGKSIPVALNIFMDACYEAPVRTIKARSVVDYEEYVATGQAKIIRLLMEAFDKKAVAVIAANAGVNPYEGDYSYADNLTTIPNADFTADNLIPYFVRVAKKNRTTDAYILDGGNLFKEYFLSTKGAQYDNGVATGALYGVYPFRHDVNGFAANDIEDYTFLIDKGAFAIVNRSRFPTPRNIVGAGSDGWMRFSDKNILRYSLDVNMSDLMPMTFIRQGQLARQAISLDVTYSLVCTAAEPDGVARWNFKLRAAVLPNPTRCDEGNTGVMAFLKDAPEA